MLAPSLAVKILANEMDITAGQKTYPKDPIKKNKTSPENARYVLKVCLSIFP